MTDKDAADSKKGQAKTLDDVLEPPSGASVGISGSEEDIITIVEELKKKGLKDFVMWKKQ